MMGPGVEDSFTEGSKRKRTNHVAFHPSISSIRQLHQQNEELQRDASESKQKKRFIWPSALHEDFLRSVFEVGLTQATVQTMGEFFTKHRLNPDVVDSHLRLLRSFVNSSGPGGEEDEQFPWHGLDVLEATPQNDYEEYPAARQTTALAGSDGEMKALQAQIEIMLSSICQQHQQIESAEKSIMSQISLYNNIIYNASRLSLGLDAFSAYHLPFDIFTKYVENQNSRTTFGTIHSHLGHGHGSGPAGAAPLQSQQPAATGQHVSDHHQHHHHHHHSHQTNGSNNGAAGVVPKEGSPTHGTSWPFDTDENSPTAFLSNASLMLEMQSHIDLHKRLQKQRDDQLSQYDPNYEMVPFDAVSEQSTGLSASSDSAFVDPSKARSQSGHSQLSGPVLANAGINLGQILFAAGQSASAGTNSGSASSLGLTGHAQFGQSASNTLDEYVWDADTECDTSDLFSFLIPDENNSSSSNNE